MACALISLEITPRSPADRQKLARALEVLAGEDPDLRISSSRAPDRTVIHATSEGHLEQVVDRLAREFSVEASLGRPTVACVETLTRSADGSAKYVKVTNGRGEYAHVVLRVHPADIEATCRFEDATRGEVIPGPFMPSVESGVRESMASGVLRGYPVVGVRVELHDGSYHDADSTDAAFRTAAAMAFQDAARKAQPVVLEPVMEVVVRTDGRHVRAVVEALQGRRGEIQSRAHEGQEVITAFVPLAELFGFEALLRTAVQWRATCSIRFAHYQPLAQDPDSDDDRSSRVGAPRRPAPDPRRNAASVPEPDDADPDTGYGEPWPPAR